MNSQRANCERLLVVLPSWVGDAVMATPTLRALRNLLPDAHITFLAKQYIRPVVDALPWYDRLIAVRKRESGAPRRPTLAKRLRARRFNAAVLMPNSFRSALLVATAGIPRRVGYDRDGRGLLLTDRLLPQKDHGQYTPISAVDYYLELARRLGAETTDRTLELHTRPEDDARADRLLREAGVAFDGRPLVLLNPGAATKGQAKLWPADRFAAVADALVQNEGATVLLSGSPGERPILDAVHATARRPLIDLPRAGSDLALLKSILRRCSLAVTNDTGTRHIAAATRTPIVSLFGPTDPAWTALDFAHERIIRSRDGAMTGIEVLTVLDAARKSLHAVASQRDNGAVMK